MVTKQKISNISLIQPADTTTKFSRQVLLTKIHAGFPSPADDYFGGRLDLNEHIVRDQEATFFVTVQGSSMIGENLHDGDLLVVEKATEAFDKQVIIARVDGEYCIRKYRKEGRRVWLESANPDYAPIEVTEFSNIQIWGRVTFSFRKH